MATIFDTLRCPRCGTTPLSVARVRERWPESRYLVVFDCHVCGHDTSLTVAEYLALREQAQAVA